MIKVAIVGAGMMGHHHARNYSYIPEVKLIAVCDPDEGRGMEVANKYSAAYYSSHKKMLQKEQIDAVSITVPTILHKDIALDFIQEGIPLLIEKPLAATYKAAKEISDEAQKKGVKILVGHIERYNPAVTALTQLIRQGVFGEILSIVVKRVGIYPPSIKGVNVVIDLAIHDLDIISSIINKDLLSVYARGGSTSHGVEDYAEIFLNFGQISCFIETNWVTPVKIRTLSVTGTKSYAELNYITQKLDVYQLKKNLTIKEMSLPQEFSSFVQDLEDSRKIEIPVIFAEPLKAELINFINSVQNKESLKVSLEDGVKAVKLAEVTNQSIKQQREVKVR